jgi:hypothetical protein
MKRPTGAILAVWILLVCALALDIAAAVWGTVLTVVIFSVAALLAAGTLKLGSRSRS